MKTKRTEKNDNPNLRPVIVAAIAASLLMLIGGLTYRALASRLLAPVSKTPIDPGALRRFPAQIGGWTGEDVPIDETIVRMTGTDAHINRRYSRGNGLESISVYIACGANSERVLGHYPEICYVGAGLSLADRRPMELSLSDGSKLPCTVLNFFGGGLDSRKVSVLNYFIVDGQYYGSLSLLRSKGRRCLGMIKYAAQVQIVTSNDSLNVDSAMRLVSAFAVDSAPLIAWLFEDIERSRRSGEFRKPLQGN